MLSFLLHSSDFSKCSKNPFNPSRHIFRYDIVFAPAGLHIVIKWTKTLQDCKVHHVALLLVISNIYLYPVRAIVYTYPRTWFSHFEKVGVTCFNKNVSLQNFMFYGLWRSSAVWSYLHNSLEAVSVIRLTFFANIPPTF